MATASYDPHLGDGPSGDSQTLLNDSDSGSVLSDDSVLPDYETDAAQAEPAKTVFEACTRNDITALRGILERGVTKDEAMELDINGRNGLMLAVGKGFVDIVGMLHTCPIDINHQDTDGNTALMIAAQAGFITILNFILNYYPGVDTEIRDPRGFTALIKAGLQGREECMAALLMHGADVNAMDLVRQRGLKEWVLKTGRFETLVRLRRLQALPVAEQFCENYIPEWPDLKQLVAKATATKTVGQRLRQRLKDSLTFNIPRDPQENGVLDHMVRMTTGVHSPLVATATRPLCPTSPPEIGKRRFAVSELLEKHSKEELEVSMVSHSKCYITSTAAGCPNSVSTTSISLTSCCQETTSSIKSFIPLGMGHRNSIFPSGCIPKIEVTNSAQLPKKEKKKKKKQKGYLEPPVWKYKEAREEKKREKKKKEKEKEEEKKAKASKNSK